MARAARARDLARFPGTMLDKLFRDFESLAEVEAHHRSLAGPLLDRG